MSQSKKSENPKNPFVRFWNEFLFAREFEYESPLSPDEMVAALQALEKKTNQSFLGFGNLQDKLTVKRHGDKAIDFKIHVHDDSWWNTGLNLHLSEGSLIANPETGMTIIKGKTRFSANTIYLRFFSLGLVF